jgi:hypothetical protein
MKKIKKMKILNLKKIFFFIIPINILLLGCAHRAMPENFNKLENNDSKNGLIIGTISFPKNQELKWDRYFFHLKFLGEKESRNSTEIEILRAPFYNSKSTEMYKTYYFAIKRIEGKYEMDNVRLFTNRGPVQYSGGINGFSIPFEVKANKVTYVGNIIYNESAKEKNSVVTLRDNFKEDIIYYRSINSKIDWKNVIQSQNTINYVKSQKN